MKHKLIFVYNADSGIFNSLTDSIHKIISPSSYKCNLCKITHGNLKMKNEWKNFIYSLSYDIEFLHKDEITHNYSINNPVFPSLYIKKESKLKLLISDTEMNNSKNLDELKSLILQKLKSI